MKEQAEEFMAMLLSAGFQRERVAEKGYEFVMALQTEQQEVGWTHSLATMMVIAAQTVRDAMPGAYRIYERSNRMR